MTEARKIEIAIERARRLVRRPVKIARIKTPCCCLCGKKIERFQRHYRLSGGLAGHCDCADLIAQTNP